MEPVSHCSYFTASRVRARIGLHQRPSGAANFSSSCPTCAATDVLALLDQLEIGACKALGVSGGGNILLHMATKQPERIRAMVLISATAYFPAQARHIMSQYADSLTEQQWEVLRQRHPGGDTQTKALLDSTKAFAASYDDMNFTPPYLSKIQARTLIVQGDRDPLYPVEISVEMARAIRQSSLWIIPDAGHGPVIGDKWAEFVKMAVHFFGNDSPNSCSGRRGGTQQDAIPVRRLDSALDGRRCTRKLRTCRYKGLLAISPDSHEVDMGNWHFTRR